VKGTIDVKQHIRINIPFCGKIAYSTREHSHDNVLTQLVRHTIEHIKIHPFGSGILSSDSGIRDIVSKFCFITQNSYNKNARQKIIAANLKPISHPYFTEYKMLQKICLRILRRDKLTFGTEKDKIYGLLFDGAWLWEEYVAKILKEKGIEHRTTIKDKLFVKDDITQNQGIIPDFICPVKNTKKASFVGDAKYKHIDTKKNREDYFQIITYMFRYSCSNGYIIFPFDKDNDNSEFLQGREREIDNETHFKVIELGMKITQKADNFAVFQNIMKQNEQEMLRLISIPSNSERV
jgi:5-methylcytosine-specific restriction endonuclease McrBC regulatory subunit McrC